MSTRARTDTTIPLFEPVRARDGSLMTEVPVPKDTMILGHLWGCNTNKSVWGDDAYEFKPERWLGELPKALDEARVPGVYSNLCVVSSEVFRAAPTSSVVQDDILRRW